MTTVDVSVRIHTYKNTTLPKPVGWRILVDPLIIEKVTSGGIVLVDETVEAKEANRYVGRVIAMGPGCFKHDIFDEVGGEPWCKIGDWVLYNQYAGSGAKIRSDEGDLVKLRFVDDKSIVATSENPASFEFDV